MSIYSADYRKSFKILMKPVQPKLQQWQLPHNHSKATGWLPDEFIKYLAA